MTMYDESPTTDLSECPPLAALTVERMIVPVLHAQFEAIWPQEAEVIARHHLPAEPAILDVGCGTGELEARLAELLPRASILGVDIAPNLLHVARRKNAGQPNVSFRHGTGAELPFADATFDAVFCRHLLQAITNPEAVLAEMVRVVKPGGVVHLVPEDYGMIFDSNDLSDTDRLWQVGWIAAGARCGVDKRIGRKCPALLRRHGMRDIRMDFAVVDSLRVTRERLRVLFRGWRDFANDWVVKHTPMAVSEFERLFASFLDTIDDPEGYVLWQVPIVSAVKP